jgi:hypothetical protein
MGFFLQIVRFGVPNSPKIGQSLNSTVQSKLLKYALAAGADYGQSDVTPKSRVSLTPATASEWNRCEYFSSLLSCILSPLQTDIPCFFGSDSLVYCRVAGGIGLLMSLMLTADARVGTGTEMVSYDAEIIDGLLPGLMFPPLKSNFATTGSISISVMGRNFGPSYVSLLGRGGYTSCEFSTWASDSSVQGLLKRGFQVTLQQGNLQPHSKFILVPNPNFCGIS